MVALIGVFTNDTLSLAHHKSTRLRQSLRFYSTEVSDSRQLSDDPNMWNDDSTCQSGPSNNSGDKNHSVSSQTGCYAVLCVHDRLTVHQTSSPQWLPTSQHWNFASPAIWFNSAEVDVAQWCTASEIMSVVKTCHVWLNSIMGHGNQSPPRRKLVQTRGFNPQPVPCDHNWNFGVLSVPALLLELLLLKSMCTTHTETMMYVIWCVRQSFFLSS